MFSAPGKCDVTADVNFDHLKHAALKGDNVKAYGPITQGQFLKGAGIEERRVSLQRRDARLAPVLRRQVEKLTSPLEMGSRFKFLGISSSGCSPLSIFPESVKRTKE